jgi:hypothetical protein
MTGALEIYNAINNPGILTNVPYSASGVVTYFLYNNTMMLDSRQVNVSCASGANKFDIISGTCADPQVISANTSGSYYNNPGSVNFTCSGADNYVVVRDPSGANVTIASGVYSTPVSVPITISDTYSVVCRKGAIASSPSLVAYATPPPPVATVEVNASPKTLTQGSKSTITWGIQYPTAACTLAAQAVCSNNACSQIQLNAAALLNTLIATTNTDSNDPNGVRPITTAVNTVAPANVGGNWKAVGKKTFTITGTTDFVADCGAGNKATVRVRVTSSGEQ